MAEVAIGRGKREIPAKPEPALAVGMAGRETIDIGALRGALEREVGGEVRFDAAALAMYANDASNFRQVPIGVVVPRTLDDIVATHRVCSRFGAPITNRGGGTSLSGETVNVAVIIDNSKYLTGSEEPDVERRLVTCEPGLINEQLNLRIGKHNLVFGPDPSSHSRCTIGGNIGNNSCGVHSVQSQLFGPGPRTSDNVHALEVLTYDGERFWVGVNEEEHLAEIIAGGGRKGEIYAKLRALRDRYADAIRRGFPSVEQLPRRVSGYNLDELLPEKGFNVARALVGTESTCVTVLRSTLMLTPAMLQRTTVVIQYEDICAAAAGGSRILSHVRPIGLEAIDHILIEDQSFGGMNMSDLEELPRRGQNAWLLVQFGADDDAEAEGQARRLVEWLEAQGYQPDRFVISRSVQDGGNSEDFWAIREAGLAATAFPPDGADHWPGWEDSAVPPDRMAGYLADLKQLYARYGLRGAFYGHIGQGCLHSRINFELRHQSGIEQYRGFLNEAADLVVSYGGTLSGEHGDGQQRAELLVKQYGEELIQAMREFKLIWDPRWKMNPGKVIDPYRLDENLKLGVDYNPHRPLTKFAYRKDGGDFAHATLRCVGVGKCRVPDAQQTMCPSYQVTREEEHCTRGRARLLWEMLRGEVITDGWQSKEVYEALDLCLACKGCTNDCPVGVDIPTYKAEFLWHHYKSLRRWRPRYAYAMGFIDQWCRLASAVPELANFAGQAPLISSLLKLVGGIDQKRSVPRFAPLTLQQWFARRGGTANPYGRPVVLFPDTFNNHLHLEVGIACVEAIEAAGWQVIMPRGHICCGRPLYDYGFLDVAERYLDNVLDALRERVRAGTPVVGMEPSCLAVFKDELVKMKPHDDDAERLKRSAYHFGEFFDSFGIEAPRMRGQALLWGHCHHRATGGIQTEEKVLRQMGLEVNEVTGGCCGLAGSWGFEAGKHDISIDCGEQALLPAVRKASTETVVVADGFSCKTQIEEAGTGRRALHLGEVMRLARQLSRSGDGAQPSRGSGGTAMGALGDGTTPEVALEPPSPQPSGALRAARTAGPLAALAGAATGAALAARWAAGSVRER
jgi:FAD/FMN-containing dehydrogenase/Fe-S oxidoreductase